MTKSRKYDKVWMRGTEEGLTRTTVNLQSEF